MRYIVAGSWHEWRDYCLRHGYEGARYVTHPSQLPKVRRRGDSIHFVGTYKSRIHLKAIHEHIKERLILA